MLDVRPVDVIQNFDLDILSAPKSPDYDLELDEMDENFVNGRKRALSVSPQSKLPNKRPKTIYLDADEFPRRLRKTNSDLTQDLAVLQMEKDQLKQRVQFLESMFFYNRNNYNNYSNSIFI